jgi:hypothetical protein
VKVGRWESNTPAVENRSKQLNRFIKRKNHE